MAHGTVGADILVATHAGETLIGGGGDDVFALGTHTDAHLVEAGSGISTAIVSASHYTLPDGIDDLIAWGGGQHALTGNAGDNYIVSGPGGGSVDGGAGNDTIRVGTGPHVLTGGAGNDTFAFASRADHGDRITDFTSGQDQLDLRSLMHSLHYAGSDPVKNHVLQFADNGHGGTSVIIDPDGSGHQHGYLLATLDHVQPSALHAGTDYLWH